MAFDLQTICHGEQQIPGARRVFSPSYCCNKGILQNSWYLEAAGNGAFKGRLSLLSIFA
jgi:hypothetical protein